MTEIKFRKVVAKMGDRKIIQMPREWLDTIEVGTIYEVTLEKVEG